MTAGNLPNGWYDQEVSNHQAILDQEINDAADHHLDYWAFDWYPQVSQDDAYKYARPYNDYKASAYKSRLKFADLVQTWWLAGGDPNDPNSVQAQYQSKWVPQLVSDFQDPQYVKVNGNHPILYWFGAANLATPYPQTNNGWGSVAAAKSAIQYLRNQTIAAGLGDLIIIDVDEDVSDALTYGFQGVSSYGSGYASPGSGHQCWEAQYNKDFANLNNGAGQGLLVAPVLTPVNDPRPRDQNNTEGFTYGFYVDQPTYSQWEQELHDMYAWAVQNPRRTTSPATMLVYAWNEIDEGGPGIVPTYQEGTKYLDAINNVWNNTYPATWTDQVNDNNCSVVYNGSGWSYALPVHSPTSGGGVYGNDEHRSSTSGNTAQLAWGGATGFQIVAATGPDQGIMAVSIDGQFDRNVDLYSATAQTYQTVYTDSGLAAGTHTITIQVTGTHNSASTGATVNLDAIRVAAARTSGSTSGTHQIVNQNSGKCLQVNNNSTDNGTQAIIWQCDQGAEKTWTLSDQGNGQYEIVNQNSGKCLQVNNNTDNGAQAIIWQCDQGAEKLWALSDQGNGQYEIVNQNSDKCLEVLNNSTDNVAQAIIWQCDQGAEKLWTLS